MSRTVPPLSDMSLFKQQAFINGKFVSAKSGETFEVTDPASGKVIGTMPEMDVSDTQLAIDAAAAAFPSFRKLTARDRSRMLHKWYQLMMENAEDLTKIISWENGKSFADARMEVEYAADYFEWFAGEATRIYGDTIASSVPGRRIHTIKEPIGVVGLITPWNWPAGMVTRKIGPALAAGCTVVLKSPGETPFTAAALAELSLRAGIPPGVVNIVTAIKNTPDVGALLTTSPTIKKVSFTGSTRVGKILMKQASSTLKKLSMELGGNAPFIVFDDADLDAAVAGAIGCKFRSSGEVCTAANRIYVQSGIYDAFVKAFAAKVAKFKIGPSYAEGGKNTHGPLIHAAAVKKVQEHIDDAVKKGGKIVLGGHQMPELGPNFFQLTVMSNMNSSMMVARDETFGPLAPIFSFDNEEEVVKLANDTEVGLAGYLFSQDISRCYRIAEAIEVGMVGVNTGFVSDPAMPFGGVKESGFGREGSRYGVDDYCTIKSVTIGGIGKELQSS